ncbi:MAG: Holliday junction branch migration protein RuvA [Synergistales bacterium]|nr:Holliday junction branch migration protein RuvA [Synergistales bacterium]
MLEFLTGTAVTVSSDMVVLDVNGLGFRITSSQQVTATVRQGESATVYVSLQLYDGGAMLYGFADSRERLLFEHFIMVKGVGGKVAMAMLRMYDFHTLVNAIVEQDVAVLSSVPGIGKRTAERICFELKERILKLPGHNQERGTATAPGSSAHSVVEALQTLGFSAQEASLATHQVKEEQGDDLSEEALLQASLRSLQKMR